MGLQLELIASYKPFSSFHFFYFKILKKTILCDTVIAFGKKKKNKRLFSSLVLVLSHPWTFSYKYIDRIKTFNSISSHKPQ